MWKGGDEVILLPPDRAERRLLARIYRDAESG
jgi:hypothetical protein